MSTYAAPAAAMARTVVATRASDGIGRAIAPAGGDRVALLARGAKGCRPPLDVERPGGPLPISVDVADAAGVFAAATRVEKELRAIDIWGKCRVSLVFAPFTDIQPVEFRRTEVTDLGYVYPTMAALRCMRPHDRGTIGNSPVTGRRRAPTDAADARHPLHSTSHSRACSVEHRDATAGRWAILAQPPRS